MAATPKPKKKKPKPSTKISPIPGMLTTYQTGAKLNINEHSVRVFLHRGMIKGVKVGNSWLISQEEIDRYNWERKAPGRPKDE